MTKESYRYQNETRHIFPPSRPSCYCCIVVCTVQEGSRTIWLQNTRDSQEETPQKLCLVRKTKRQKLQRQTDNSNKRKETKKDKKHYPHHFTVTNEGKESIVWHCIVFPAGSHLLWKRLIPLLCRPVQRKTDERAQHHQIGTIPHYKEEIWPSFYASEPTLGCISRLDKGRTEIEGPEPNIFTYV